MKHKGRILTIMVSIYYNMSLNKISIHVPMAQVILTQILDRNKRVIRYLIMCSLSLQQGRPVSPNSIDIGVEKIIQMTKFPGTCTLQGTRNGMASPEL